MEPRAVRWQMTSTTHMHIRIGHADDEVHVDTKERTWVVQRDQVRLAWKLVHDTVAASNQRRLRE
jgi:hypothetical protein